MSNQALSFDYPDAATDARMLRVDLPSRFFKTEQESDAPIQELSVCEQLNAKKTMHLRDDNFDARCATLQYRALYFNFLMHRHQKMHTEQGSIPAAVPEEYLYQSEEVSLKGNSLEAIVEDLFEITGDHNQGLSSKQIVTHITMSRSKFAINAVTLGRHLTRLTKASDG